MLLLSDEFAKGVENKATDARVLMATLQAPHGRLVFTTKETFIHLSTDEQSFFYCNRVFTSYLHLPLQFEFPCTMLQM